MNTETLGATSRTKEIADALEMQMRVISAIILREAKSRYGEHRLGFFWVLIEPTLYIVGFGLLRALLRVPPPNGMSIEFFLLTGLAPFLLFRDTMNSVAGAITANKALLGFPQVSTFDLIFARAILELAKILCVFTMLTVALILYGVEADIERPIVLLGAFLMMFITGLGVGAILCTASSFFPSVKTFSGQLLGRPLFFTSGLFFTAESLPSAAREILLYNPLLHIVELSRSAFFKSFESRYVDLEYSLLFCLLLLLCGLTLHKALYKKILGL